MADTHKLTPEEWAIIHSRGIDRFTYAQVDQLLASYRNDKRFKSPTTGLTDIPGTYRRTQRYLIRTAHELDIAYRQYLKTEIGKSHVTNLKKALFEILEQFESVKLARAVLRFAYRVNNRQTAMQSTPGVMPYDLNDRTP